MADRILDAGYHHATGVPHSRLVEDFLYESWGDEWADAPGNWTLNDHRVAAAHTW